MTFPVCRACTVRHDPLWTCQRAAALAPKTAPNAGVVVNEKVVVNAARAKDRHRKSPERAAFMRKTMRARRSQKGK